MENNEALYTVNGHNFVRTRRGSGPRIAGKSAMDLELTRLKDSQ